MTKSEVCGHKYTSLKIWCQFAAKSVSLRLNNIFEINCINHFLLKIVRKRLQFLKSSNFFKGPSSLIAVTLPM